MASWTVGQSFAKPVVCTPKPLLLLSIFFSTPRYFNSPLSDLSSPQNARSSNELVDSRIVLRQTRLLHQFHTSLSSCRIPGTSTPIFSPFLLLTRLYDNLLLPVDSQLQNEHRIRGRQPGGPFGRRGAHWEQVPEEILLCVVVLFGIGPHFNFGGLWSSTCVFNFFCAPFGCKESVSLLSFPCFLLGLPLRISKNGCSNRPQRSQIYHRLHNPHYPWHSAVVDTTSGRFSVDISMGTCQCGLFQYLDIPCAQAVAFIRKLASRQLQVFQGQPSRHILDFIPDHLWIMSLCNTYGEDTNIAPLGTSLTSLSISDDCFVPRLAWKKGPPRTKRAFRYKERLSKIRRQDVLTELGLGEVTRGVRVGGQDLEPGPR